MSDAVIVLDPTDESTPANRQRVERLEGVAGKTIGLLDISKARGDVFLARVAELLTARGATVEHFRKPTFARLAPVDVRQEIAARCDAVIEALAD